MLHKIVKVLKYTADIQEQFGLKTKPEPWLHIGFIGRPTLTDNRVQRYVIYVWDTRKVIAVGNLPGLVSLQKLHGIQPKDNFKSLGPGFKFDRKSCLTNE